MLKHAHGWVAKQAVQIDVNQTISITSALHEASRRVIEGLAEPADTLPDEPPDEPARHTRIEQAEHADHAV